jgi:hypothetical protein
MNKAEKILLTVVGLISAPFIASWAHEQWIFSSPERVYAHFKEETSAGASSEILCSKQKYLYYIAHNLHKSAKTATDVDRLIGLRKSKPLNAQQMAALGISPETESTKSRKLVRPRARSSSWHESADCATFDYVNYLQLKIFFDKQERLVETVLSGKDPKTGKFIENQIVWKSDSV